MSTSRFSSSETDTSTTKEALTVESDSGKQKDRYQWTALSVTTVGALLASIQGSALLIALPNIMGELHASFFTIMWVLMGYLLITTVLTPIVGRLADMWGRKRLYNSGFAVFVFGSLDKLFEGDLKNPLTPGLVGAIVGLGVVSWVLGVVLERNRS